jgi:hypothetical protein
MKQVSMKLAPPEPTSAEKMYPSMACGPDSTPEYPYGLRICLQEEQLKALGLTELPETGTTVTISAKGEVSSTSAYDDQNRGVQRTLEIQLVSLGLGDS